MIAKFISLDGLEKILEVPDNTTIWQLACMKPLSAKNWNLNTLDNLDLSMHKTTYRLEGYEPYEEKLVTGNTITMDRDIVRHSEESVVIPSRIAIFRQVFEEPLKTLNDIRKVKKHNIEIGNIIEMIDI